MYGLYAAEDLYTEIGYHVEDDKWINLDVPEMVVKKDTLIAITTTKEDGRATFMEDLPLGTYYVKELEAPEGYILSEEEVFIDGSYNSEKGGQLVDKQIHLAAFENKRIEGYEPKPEIPSKPSKKEPPELVEVAEVREPATPQPVATGDHANLVLWSGVFLGALQGGLLLWKRKKKS